MSLYMNDTGLSTRRGYKVDGNIIYHDGEVCFDKDKKLKIKRPEIEIVAKKNREGVWSI